MTNPVPWAVAALFLFYWFTEWRNPDQLFNLITAFLCCAYIGIMYGVALPRWKDRHTIHWWIAVLNSLVLGSLLELNTSYPAPMMLALIMIVVSSTASLAGRWPTFTFMALFLLVMTVQKDTVLGRQITGIGWSGGLVVATALVTEIIIRLEMLITEKIKRLEAINKIARIISSSIEFEEIVPRLNQAIHETIEADSHFLGLVKGDKLEIQWFYDEGQFFPTTEVPLEGTLSAWVVNNHTSLLLNNLPKEGPKYGMDTKTVGKEKLSQSWIGTPLTANQQVIGIVALASYHKFAFQTEDLELLESVAQQAAMVLDNAYHHAEAVERSRRDSMTQVFNHEYLLTCLQTHIKDPKLQPFSVMMVDVDFFKPFNDTHGHLIGDLALKEVVNCLRCCLRETDSIGRWGGEEFCVLLPNTTASQAVAAAARVHELVNCTSITLASGNKLPLPTISVGVVQYPTDASKLDDLVHLADQRMYEAKRRGRKQTVAD